MSPAIKIERVHITCADRRALCARVFEAAEMPGNPPNGTVIINSATGIRQSYYSEFASFLAALGYRVLTWDGRGIGESQTKAVLNDDARMRDWGTLDFSAMLQFADREYAQQSDISVIGHSSGGHLAALAPNFHLVQRLILVASGTCFWRRYPLAQWPKLLLVWRVIVPLTLAIRGYWPAALGVGHDLPKGVATDWRQWSLMPEYFFDDASVDSSGFDAYSGQILCYSLSDDLAFSPPTAVQHLLSKFKSATVTHRLWTPNELQQRRVGHFGFFRNASRSGWDALASWLAQTQAH